MDSTNSKILMEHNIKVYEEAKEYIEKHGKVAVVQPTGTGKSYIAMQIMQDMGKCKKLVIAPSRNFLDFMQNNKHWDSNAITLTYAYITRNSDLIENKILDMIGSIEDIELIVIDEFHRAGAPEWGKALEKIINKCQNAKILGLSANPIRSNNRDMVDELFDGYSVGNTSLHEAVAEEILPRMHYILGVASANNEINKMFKFNDENKCFFEKIEKQVEELKTKWDTTNTFKNTLKKYLIPNNTDLYTEGLESRHIVFLTKIKDLEEHTDTIKQWFSEIYTGYTIDIGFIHSNMSKKHNNQVLRQFSSNIAKNTIKVIVTIQMMNESFHFDSVKSISMFRYTEAPNVFIQQIGRALSANSQSPYIFDFVENFSSVGYLAFTAGSNNTQEVNLNSIFKSFNDETKSCAKDIEELNKKLNSRVSFFTQLLPSLAKQYGCLYNITEINLRNWAIKRFKKLKAEKSDIITSDYLKLTSFIADYAGEEWYNYYKKYPSLTPREINKFEEKTHLLFECNCINIEMQAEITKNTGIQFDTTNNLIDYYIETVKVSHHQECKQIARLVKAFKDKNTFDCIRYMQICENTYRFTKKINPTFCVQNFDKAYAYRIWEIILKDKGNIALLNYKFTCEQLIIQRAFKSYTKYSTPSLTYEEFISLNNGILSRDIEDNDDITREILSYFSITNKKKLISVIDCEAKFTSTVETFNQKSKLILNGTITNQDAIASIEEEVDIFIKRYKHANIIEHFREIYDKFESETLSYIAIALQNDKYINTNKAIKLIKRKEKRERIARDTKALYDNTKYERAKVHVSLMNILGLSRMHEDVSLEELIARYVDMINTAVKQDDVSFNMDTLYRLNKLYSLGLKEYKGVLIITENKSKMELVDMLVLKQTLRKKIKNTVKFMESGMTFKNAAVNSNLYNKLTQRDKMDLDNILDSGIMHSESLIYSVMEGIEQLPSEPYKTQKKNNRVKE